MRPATVTSVTPALRRQVISHAGVSCAEVAALLGCSVAMVRNVRSALGRSLEDGNPYGTPVSVSDAQPALDFDRLMRTNHGVL